MKYYPKQAVWELTLRCNMRCLHCGSRAGTAREDELSLDECLDIAQQLIDMDCEEITLIGGEVFVHKDWHIIARKFIDAGVKANIITNAFLLGNRQMAQLKQSGIEIVGISLDGMEKTHNKIRGNEKSFQKVLEAFKKLKDAGYKIAVITTILKDNFEELEEIYSLLVENNVDLWQLQLASPMGNASDNNDILVSPDKVHEITKLISDKKNLGKIFVIGGDNVGYFNKYENNIRLEEGEDICFDGCYAGLYVIGLDSVGNVKGCESLYSDKFIEGNLRENSLKEIWNRPGAFAYNREFKPEMLEGHCKGCDMGPYCAGGCRQLSYFSSGHYYDNKYCCYPNKPKLAKEKKGKSENANKINTKNNKSKSSKLKEKT